MSTSATTARRHAATGALACAALLAVSATSSSCTLLWLLNNDPAGLPCDFNVAAEGACLDGYTCVEQGEGEFVCVVAGAAGVGEPCASSDQCGEDLVCDSLYAELCAGDGADDPNCSIIPNEEKELGCRQVCDIGNPATCPDDTRCIDGVGAEPDFCQQAICATDTDCQVVAGNGALCVGEGFNEGTSGLCFQGCDPLACQDGVCDTCTGVDGVVDTDKTCVPALDEIVSDRTVCDLAGALDPFADCSGGEGCRHGTFCGAVASGAVCLPWCRVGGGNPACPVGSDCAQVAGALGVCLRAGD